MEWLWLLQSSNSRPFLTLYLNVLISEPLAAYNLYVSLYKQDFCPHSLMVSLIYLHRYQLQRSTYFLHKKHWDGVSQWRWRHLELAAFSFPGRPPVTGLLTSFCLRAVIRSRWHFARRSWLELSVTTLWPAIPVCWLSLAADLLP